RAPGAAPTGATPTPPSPAAGGVPATHTRDRSSSRLRGPCEAGTRREAVFLTRRRGDAEQDAENGVEKVKTWERGVSGDSEASQRRTCQVGRLIGTWSGDARIRERYLRWRRRTGHSASLPPGPLAPLPPRSQILTPLVFLPVLLRVSASPRQIGTCPDRFRQVTERSCESHPRAPVVSAARIATVFGRIMPRRKRPYSSHSASSPREPAKASHGHKSVDDSRTRVKRGTPRCASAGGVHFDSHNSGSVSE